MRPEVAAGAVVTIAVLAAALLVALVLLALTLVEVRRVRRRTQRLEAELATERGRGAGPGRPRTVLTAEKALRTVVDTAVRVRHQGVGGLVMSSLDELSRWAMEDRSEIVRLAAADGSVTILFSDIEGSTSMNDELGDEGWVQLLIAHDTMVRAHVERRGGHIVKSQGDGFMVAFDKPARGQGGPGHPAILLRGALAAASSPADQRPGGHPLRTGGEPGRRLLRAQRRHRRPGRGGGPARAVELKGVPGARTLHPVTRSHGPVGPRLTSEAESCAQNKPRNQPRNEPRARRRA